MQGKEGEDERVSGWDFGVSRLPMFFYLWGKNRRWKGYLIHHGAAKMEAVSAVIREIDGKVS